MSSPHKGYWTLKSLKAKAGHKPEDNNKMTTAAVIRPGGEDFKMQTTTAPDTRLRTAHAHTPTFRTFQHQPLRVSNSISQRIPARRIPGIYAGN